MRHNKVTMYKPDDGRERLKYTLIKITTDVNKRCIKTVAIRTYKSATTSATGC
jgi:hypothetical protein